MGTRRNREREPASPTGARDGHGRGGVGGSIDGRGAAGQHHGGGWDNDRHSEGARPPGEPWWPRPGPDAGTGQLDIAPPAPPLRGLPPASLRVTVFVLGLPPEAILAGVAAMVDCAADTLPEATVTVAT